MKRIGIIAAIIAIMLLSVAFVSAVAPVLTVSSCATKAVEDEAYTCTVTATDPGDVLIYSLTTKPDGMTINSATGAITWTPDDEQIGSHTVTVKVIDNEATPLSDEETFTIFVRPASVCGDYTSGTDIKITDLEITDDDEDFYPGSEIEMTVDIENDGDDDLEDVVVEAVLYDATDGKKLDVVQTEEFDLDEDDETSPDLTLEVPKDIDESNTIILFVSVYEDGNDDENCDYEYNDDLDFRRRKHDITVNLPTDSALTVKPGKTVEVRFDIENVGARDEEGVYITLKNSELGIDKKSEAFDIDAYEKGDDDEYTITMILSVLSNAKPGDYELEIQTYNEDGKVYSSGMGFVTLIVEGTTTTAGGTTTATGTATITVEGVSETLELGKAYSIPVKITNTASTDKEYKILLTNLADWAESTSVIDAYLTPGQTSTYYVTITPKTDATEGQHSATINVKEGTTTITTKTLSFTIPESDTSITSGAVVEVKDTGAFQNIFSGTTFWMIGDIVLVIVGIFFVKMLFSKKETE